MRSSVVWLALPAKIVGNLRQSRQIGMLIRSKICESANFDRVHNTYKEIASYGSGRRNIPLQAGRSGGCPAKIEEPALLLGLFKLCGEHGSYFATPNPFAKLHGDQAVTTKAECPNVVEVALAAPFRYRHNMIRIP